MIWRDDLRPRHVVRWALAGKGSYLMPKALNLKTSLFLILPQKPVDCDLGAQDGEEEREDAVLEVVAVGRVDDEGAGDCEGGDHEKEGNAEYGEAQGPADGTVAAGFVARQVRVRVKAEPALS